MKPAQQKRSRVKVQLAPMPRSVTLLGATFMVSAAVTDAIYALLAGRARLFFSARRTRLLSRVSGGFMIGGGIWLALTGLWALASLWLLRPAPKAP